MNKDSKKYFLTYAEPETQVVDLLFSKLNKHYQHVLCIPAFDEPFASIKHILERKFDSESLLLVLVVNEPLPDNKNLKVAQKHIGDLAQASKNTLQLIRDIKQHYPVISQQSVASLHSLTQTQELLLIERVGEQAIPYHQGVGLARKIANDCAAKLIHDELISTPILFNTDADANLPAHYFNKLEYQNTTAAWLYPFEHQKSPNAQLYQKSLQHYVDGLSYAKSPYAFHTIGSTLALNARHYINARGFPKKNAGEDFYLLNKLAKLGSIEQANTTKITLSARHSHRVPFGTGLQVKNMEKSQQPKELAMFYHPLCFEYLKAFLLLNTMTESFDAKSFLSDAGKPLSSECLEDLLIRFSPRSKAKENRPANPQLSRKQFFEAFDAFQHLKLIHYLRDNYFPSFSYENLNKYRRKA